MAPVWDDSGLVAAVVQDAVTSSVLMLGWMTPDAFRLTEETGRVHFWSRSRQELWEKGASSGNYFELVSMAADCDGDALLVKVHPRGPACHTGTTTCWGDDDRAGLAILGELWTVIAGRAATRPAGSYTTSLLSGGPEAPGRKLVEEAMEVLLAAKDHYAGAADDRRVAEEAADLIYHLMVLLSERSIPPAAVLEVLTQRRH
jgi:phosphoribosyl-ATP pyrophosphohydrolase/phosphoribosyl-AMP cyclohydrolase